MGDQAMAAPVCDHYWAWVSPAGTSNSARICMTCHQPDPKWLNEIAAEPTSCPCSCDKPKGEARQPHPDTMAGKGPR